MELTLQQTYQLFITDRETSCAPETIEYYRDNLKNFFLWCAEHLDRPLEELQYTEITREVFRDYILYLRKRPKFQTHPFLEASDDMLSNSSIRTYARAIKAFANYCKEEGYGENFTYRVKLPKDDSKEIIPLYASEVERIDRQFSMLTEQGRRNWCIVHLMLDAGLRSSEVVELQIDDLIFDKNIIRLKKAKGDKTRLVIMAPKLKNNLLKYMIFYRKYETLPKGSPVFIQLKDREPINKNVIKQLFSRLKKKTNIDRLHPHLMRHTFATSYICGGGNIEMLRLLLGHYDYEVTKMYLHLAQQSQLLHTDIYRLDPVFFKKYE